MYGWLGKTMLPMSKQCTYFPGKLNEAMISNGNYAFQMEIMVFWSNFGKIRQFYPFFCNIP